MRLQCFIVNKFLNVVSAFICISNQRNTAYISAFGQCYLELLQCLVFTNSGNDGRGSDELMMGNDDDNNFILSYQVYTIVK